MSRRLAVPKSIETELLVACQRRCCLCFYLDGFKGVKKGQMAHLNRRRDDNRLENLAWLCLEHHDAFDSITSQSKNYTQEEVRRWRDRLHSHFSVGHAPGARPLPMVMPSPPPERPWRYPPWRNADRPELFPFRSRNRIDGVCVIERIPLEDGRTVIACISVPGNPGASITNTVETICQQVCLEFEIKPADIVWLENYEYINPTEWLHVTFDKMPPGGWHEPKWTEMDRRMWAALGLRPVARLRSHGGELVSKLRRIRKG